MTDQEQVYDLLKAAKSNIEQCENLIARVNEDSGYFELTTENELFLVDIKNRVTLLLNNYSVLY